MIEMHHTDLYCDAKAVDRKKFQRMEYLRVIGHFP